MTTAELLILYIYSYSFNSIRSWPTFSLRCVASLVPIGKQLKLYSIVIITFSLNLFCMNVHVSFKSCVCNIAQQYIQGTQNENSNKFVGFE